MFSHRRLLIFPFPVVQAPPGKNQLKIRSNVFPQCFATGNRCTMKRYKPRMFSRRQIVNNSISGCLKQREITFIAAFMIKPLKTRNIYDKISLKSNLTNTRLGLNDTLSLLNYKASHFSSTNVLIIMYTDPLKEKFRENRRSTPCSF